MEKIDVMVYVPAIGKMYELLLPIHITIGSMLPVIINVIKSGSDMLYHESGQEFLSSVGLGMILADNKTLADFGVSNGDQLVLL